MFIKYVSMYQSIDILVSVCVCLPLVKVLFSGIRNEWTNGQLEVDACIHIHNVEQEWS